MRRQRRRSQLIKRVECSGRAVFDGRTSASRTFCTNPVVAMLVSSSLVEGVGARGLPVSDGACEVGLQRNRVQNVKEFVQRVAVGSGAALDCREKRRPQRPRSCPAT